MRIFCARALLSFCSVLARQRINLFPLRRKGVRENTANRVFPNTPQKNHFKSSIMSKTDLTQSAPVKGGASLVTAADSLQCISLGCCVPPCQVSDMDQDFLAILLLAQKFYGKKFKINSAFRSVAYEKKQGRNGRSSHCKGVAVDISCRDHGERILILRALFRVGFNRIGIGQNFIHVDLDRSKYASVWLYHPQNNGTF